MFSAGGETIGGMFTKQPEMPVPYWAYYFNVGDIDVAMRRVKAGGGGIPAARSKCRAEAGWSNARTRRAPFSRCRASGPTTASDISSAPHRAIPPTFVLACASEPTTRPRDGLVWRISLSPSALPRVIHRNVKSKATLALLWQIFTHAAARQISIFGSVGIAVEAVEPRAREWRDVRRAELAGAVGR